MKRSWFAVASGLVAGAVGLSASAAPLSITSVVEQNGGLFAQTTGGAYTFTSGLGFDFTGQAYNTLTTLDEIMLSLSVNDGDSDVGDFDENNLFLTLDGINTGMQLKGFTNGQIVTLDFDQLAPATGAAILTALKADGFLVGGVFDTDADGPAGDVITFPRLVDTSLTLIGDVTTPGGGGGNPVPLPAAVLVAPLGAGLAGAYARRFRRGAKAGK